MCVNIFLSSKNGLMKRWVKCLLFRNYYKTWAVPGTSHWDASCNITTIHAMRYQIPTSAKWQSAFDLSAVTTRYREPSLTMMGARVSQQSCLLCKQILFGPYRPTSSCESALFRSAHQDTIFIPDITDLCTETWAGVARTAVHSPGWVPEVEDCCLFSAPEG